MLGSITRTYTTRQWKDFDHLLVFLQSMVADGGKIVADDEIRIYFEQHQRDALLGEYIYDNSRGGKIKQSFVDLFDRLQMDMGIYSFTKALLAKFKNVTFDRNSRELQAAVETFLCEGGTVRLEHVREEIIGNAIGGSETTIIFMNFACYYLAKNPDCQNKLRTELKSGVPLEEVKYFDWVLSETLRLASPAFVNSRELNGDVELSGDTMISSKLIPWVCQFYMHRESEFWSDPEKFDPERWAKSPVPGSYFPFGMGKRRCVGEFYAIREATVSLAHMISKFEIRNADPNYKLEKPEDFNPDLTLRAKRPIMLVLKKIE